VNGPPDILVFFAAGDPEAAEALGEQLGARRTRALDPAPGSAATRMAAALVAAETVIGDQQPGAEELCGSGPEVGAAALVAAKLGVPAARVSPAAQGASDDHAVLADLDGAIAERLCGLVVPAEDGAPRVAEAIRAWLATETGPYTLSP